MQGATTISPNFTALIIEFSTCDKEYLSIETNRMEECASDEEIEAFLNWRSPTVSFTFGANYIDFEDNDNPLQKSF